MDIFVFISNFLYRIRYKLLLGTAAAVILAIYATSFLPKVYSVSTTIFTGITSKATIDDNGRADWNTANNAHDNILNLIRSKSTLESVSINLLAQHLIYGDPKKDNRFITAKHYNDLISIVPAHVMSLVDKSSFENTVKNLKAYKREGKGNFIYEIFNWDNKYYGHLSLSEIKAARKGSSDMIDISYQCDDPGIAVNTLTFLNQELSFRYESMLLSTSKDIVKYFEEQLKIAREKLNTSEDDLVAFNIDNKIINYPEQTKHLAALNNAFEARYEEILLTYNSSRALEKRLEKQLETRSKLMRENEQFINALEEVSTLNGQIAEIEIFGIGQNATDSLAKYHQNLGRTEMQIRSISDKLDKYKYSKEGVAINEMVTEWLDAVLKSERSGAELDVMNKRKEEIIRQFDTFSPVGPNLSRRDREVKIDEESYLTIHHFLNTAKLKQKNILLDAGMLQIVTAPDLPLLVKARKRELFVIAAFFAAIIFIVGFFLTLELFDRTVRDGLRAERLTKSKVIGAVLDQNSRSARRYGQEIRRMAISQLTNSINNSLIPDARNVINIISVRAQEGKSEFIEDMHEYWSECGFNVASVACSPDKESELKSFLRANTIDELPGTTQKIEGVDIVLAEYGPLERTNIPKALLNSASLNILVINAQRAWFNGDNQMLINLKQLIGQDDKLVVVLTNADREAVESYTGQLPPYTFLRGLAYRLLNFGITATR